MVPKQCPWGSVLENGACFSIMDSFSFDKDTWAYCKTTNFCKHLIIAQIREGVSQGGKGRHRQVKKVPMHTSPDPLATLREN